MSCLAPENLRSRAVLFRMQEAGSKVRSSEVVKDLGLKLSSMAPCFFCLHLPSTP